MKILFVSQWYSPEPDGRVSTLAEGLVKLGHEVVVITGFPNYPTGKIYDGYRIRWHQWEELNGVKVLRLPLYPDHSRSALKRALNYLSFMLSSLLLAPWFIKKIDVVWAYTPFMTLPVLWYKILFRVPFVMEIADIWPDTIIATGMMKEGFVLNALSRLANLAYKHAAVITVQNSGFKTCLVNRGVEPEKVVLIENWADEQIYFPVEYNHEKAKRNNLDGKFNIMFAGNMGLAQNLDNIIEAAKLCEDEAEIQFVFIGDGVCFQQMKDMSQERSLTNVLFLGRKPAREMAGYFSMADVLLVTLKDEPLFEITLPAKTQSYLACGKPIIIAKRGEDAKSLQEYGCALNCEPENPKALAKLIKEFYGMPPEIRKKFGDKGLELYQARYKKEKLLLKMEKALKDAV